MLRGVIRKCSWLKCLSFGVGRFVGHVEQRGVVDGWYWGLCWGLWVLWMLLVLLVY
jgi:hypothetical protein